MRLVLQWKLQEALPEEDFHIRFCDKAKNSLPSSDGAKKRWLSSHVTPAHWPPTVAPACEQSFPRTCARASRTHSLSPSFPSALRNAPATLLRSHPMRRLLTVCTMSVLTSHVRRAMRSFSSPPQNHQTKLTASFFANSAKQRCASATDTPSSWKQTYGPRVYGAGRDFRHSYGHGSSGAKDHPQRRRNGRGRHR